MLREVVVRAVGNAPELAPAEREEELEVRRCLGVEAQLLGIVVAQAEVLSFRPMESSQLWQNVRQ